MSDQPYSNTHLTVIQAASVLRVSTKTIYRMIRSGRLVSIKDNTGRRQIDKASIIQALNIRGQGQGQGQGQTFGDVPALRQEVLRLRSFMLRIIELHEPSSFAKIQQKQELLRDFRADEEGH